MKEDDDWTFVGEGMKVVRILISVGVTSASPDL